MNINAKIAAIALNSLFRSLRPLKSKSVPLAAGKTRKNNSLCLLLNLLHLQGPELQAGADLREGRVVADRGRGLCLFLQVLKPDDAARAKGDEALCIHMGEKLSSPLAAAM